MSEYIISIPDTYINSNELPQHIRVNSLNLQEIVRCRDCGRYEYDCDWNNPDLDNPDGFCAWSVRKVDA